MSLECKYLQPETVVACKNGIYSFSLCILILTLQILSSFSLPLNLRWPHDFIWPNRVLGNMKQERTEKPFLRNRARPFLLHLEPFGCHVKGLKLVIWKMRGRVKKNQGHRPESVSAVPTTDTWDQPSSPEPAADQMGPPG